MIIFQNIGATVSNLSNVLLITVFIMVAIYILNAFGV